MISLCLNLKGLFKETTTTFANTKSLCTMDSQLVFTSARNPLSKSNCVDTKEVLYSLFVMIFIEHIAPLYFYSIAYKSFLQNPQHIFMVAISLLLMGSSYPQVIDRCEELINKI